MLRFGALDFKPYSRDGLGVDWPIDYDDLKPWYDRSEKLMGVIGENIDLPNVPHSPPGCASRPPVPRVPELLLKAACDDMGIPCIAPPRRGDHPPDRRPQRLLLRHALRSRLLDRRELSGGDGAASRRRSRPAMCGS